MSQFIDTENYIKKITHQNNWSDLFLSWFSSQEVNLTEKEINLGGLRYYLFSSSKSHLHSGQSISGFGCDIDRKQAALKCAAETIEREVMLDYFEKDFRIPLTFQTTNGWAVHSSIEDAKINSQNEALERHLLLKSFLVHGWDGFTLHSKMESDDITLYLNTAKYACNGKSALLVAAKSKKYQGVSFGYGLKDISDLENSEAWLSSIFESVTRLKLNYNFTEEQRQQSWIREEISHYLEDNFDFKVFKNRHESNKEFFITESYLEASTEIINLANAHGLNFPLFAAYTRGQNYLPLFSKKMLTQKDLEYLRPILKYHGISKLPPRVPIL